MKDMTSIIVCFPVPKEAVGLLWGTIGPMMEKSAMTTRGKFDGDDIRARIENGEYLLWVIDIDGQIVAGITTRIIEYPGCKSLSLDWIAGIRMSEWIETAQSAMEKHARHNGCAILEGYGRDAWLRWTRRFGWKESYTAFCMELKDEPADQSD
jgi:hypothetical protein